MPQNCVVAVWPDGLRDESVRSCVSRTRSVQPLEPCLPGSARRVILVSKPQQSYNRAVRAFPSVSTSLYSCPYNGFGPRYQVVVAIRVEDRQAGETSR